MPVPNLSAFGRGALPKVTEGGPSALGQRLAAGAKKAPDREGSLAAHQGFLPKRGQTKGPSALAQRTGAHRARALAPYKGALPAGQASADKPASFFERNKKNIGIGAATATAGAGGAYVSKSDATSAFGVDHGYEGVSKKLMTPRVPLERTKTLLAPYKGATQKTKSSLPLQAKLAGARLDRKRGTTKTPFGRG
jgi:hypothetical protein